jgi:hypothetical protein
MREKVIDAEEWVTTHQMISFQSPRFRRRECYSTMPPTTDEIRRLGARIAIAERDLANDKTTLDKLIQIARRQGASWAKIGEALGISAQAAHQRAARKATSSAPDLRNDREKQ